MRLLAVAVLLLAAPAAVAQPSARPLDDFDPYYPHLKYPRLITPQWVGEDGVEAVVVLAIDDMKDPARYEAYLRPILRRLKEIDGRAPVSIMSCSVKPDDPQLQAWLKEGLSIECHTFDHPCPFFKIGFAKAKETYEKCVDLMASVPNNKPVAFRMPCCDSMNTPSPRFWAEIFNKKTPKGSALTIDSSVFNVFTSADPALPRELVLDEKGQERFAAYLPKDRSFVNTIENYPYPYVIGRLCWEFPCMTPSDWQAQHRHKPNNPLTLRDWKAALDCTVIKQGIFCMVFHPHGWIKSEQVVEFIDHAVSKHGKKVKFLTFREAQERLNKSLFDGESLRGLRTSQNSSTILVDPADNGFLEIFTSQLRDKQLTNTWRCWSKADGKWEIERHRAEVVGGVDDVLKFRVKNLPAWVSVPSLNPIQTQAEWNPTSLTLQIDAARPNLKLYVTDFKGVRGVQNDKKLQSPLLSIVEGESSTLVPFRLPPGSERTDGTSGYAGLRFLDLDGDGKLDVLFSNEKEYGVYLFKDLKEGWSRKVVAGKQGEAGALPPIAKNGTNNGFWVHSGQLWWSNEDTVLLKDHVDRRSIAELLKQAGK